MTAITWSEFPEIKVPTRGQDMALIACEMFLPQSYAIDKEKFGHITRKLVNIGCLTGGFWLASELQAHASASINEMEGKAQAAYAQLIWIAKWVIAAKGGWSTIHKMLNEDFEGAKKSFLQYLIIFAIVMAFPRALNYIEAFFK